MEGERNSYIQPLVVYKGKEREKEEQLSDPVLKIRERYK